MIKWFCDICGKEILAPDHPVQLTAGMQAKNRDDIEVGWGEYESYFKLWAHPKCAQDFVFHFKGFREEYIKSKQTKK